MTPVATAADPAILLNSVRQYLIDNGVVREPRVAGSLPPCWLDPRKGMPYPGQKEGLDSPGVESHPDLVLAMYPETGVVSGPFMGFYVQRAVTIWFRGRLSPLVQRIHETLRGLLHDKRDLQMGDLYVNQSMMFRELQRIGSDTNGWTYNVEYMFDLFGAD